MLTVPNRATAGYTFFGVESNPGYPDSAFLDGNPTNQITNFIQQATTLVRDGETVVIGVSTAEQSAAICRADLDTGVRAMKLRLWPFAKSEHRTYTSTAVDALVDRASGNTLQAGALGAVEVAAGLWARSFATADVEPQTPATRALTPSTLASIGRELAARGEYLGVHD